VILTICLSTILTMFLCAFLYHCLKGETQTPLHPSLWIRSALSKALHLMSFCILTFL
jgi:hypothetical protein